MNTKREIYEASCVNELPNSSIVSLRDVSFRYPQGKYMSLKNISLEIAGGEAVLLTGKTGCGKSTLLKLFNGIIPHESNGELTGEIRICGMDTEKSSIPVLAQLAGLVFQTPDDQIFTQTVRSEVAFGPENMGLNKVEVSRRVAAALEAVGLSGFEPRKTRALSGGQKQRLAIASQLSLRPQILALDEPVSQIDPSGAREVMACLRDLKESGITIVVVEHRIPETLPLVDRIVVMDEGSVVADFRKSELPDHLELFDRLGLKIPDELAVCDGLGLRVTEDWGDNAVAGVRKVIAGAETANENRAGTSMTQGDVSRDVVRLRRVTYFYKGSMEAAVDAVSLDIHDGDVVAVMGHNGCGKSTLLSLMAGLFRPSGGDITFVSKYASDEVAGRHAKNIGMVFQNPDMQLFEKTLADEIAFGPANMKCAAGEIKLRVRELAVALGLDDALGNPALSLSKGRRLRAALAAVLSMEPSLLLLDEPTTGQNRESIADVLSAIKMVKRRSAVVFTTHDVETAAVFAGRVVMMKAGRIIADDTPEVIFQDIDLLETTGVRPPVATVLAKRCGLPVCLSVDAILKLCEDVANARKNGTLSRSERERA